jgi:hypothetical protein
MSFPGSDVGRLRAQVLTYRFAVGWDWAEAGAYVRFSMARFPDTSPDQPAEEGLALYSFVSTPASFALDLDGDLIAESTDQRDVLHRFSWHVNSIAMRSATDRVVLHAGAVVTPSGEAILLPGPSGSGKTSLVAELVRKGFGYLSDEAAGIDPEDSHVMPYPKALSIKQPMFARFSGTVDHSQSWPLSGRMWLIDPETLREGSIAAPSAARFVIFPSHRPTASTRLSPMNAADALIALHENTANRPIFGHRALTILGQVVTGALMYRLETSDPDEAVRVVMELTAR